MNEIQLHRLDLNLLVVFEALMEAQSVSGAAERLGKTPSAVSHALGRLRVQLGDPLMVRVGGKMQPSPFASDLIEELRPVLRRIHRMVQPPRPFDPATSRRVFRLALPAFPPLVLAVMGRVQAEAPGVGIEWLSATPATYGDVAEARVDMGALGADTPLPDGVAEHRLAPLRRYTFARDGHPALADWGRAAWLQWPHIMVGVSDAARQTVGERTEALGLTRHVGAVLPDFAGIGALLARTDMLANQLALTMADDLARHDLRVLMPPVPLPDFTMRLFWSARLASDPGLTWLRKLVIGAVEETVARAETAVAEAGVVSHVP